VAKVAVFLDRDGVINQDTGYVAAVDDFHFIDGAIEALQLLKKKGYCLVVVTNQSGIARGFFTEKQFMHLTEWMDWSLADRDVDLDGIYYCPHLQRKVKRLTVRFVTAVNPHRVCYSTPLKSWILIWRILIWSAIKPLICRLHKLLA